MAPIRIGFIGLSASGSWASGAHLPYLKDSTKYVITALCNSSIEAAEAAKDKYGLPASTKTYGSPSELAADPEVDLVVSSTRVDKHFNTIKPAIEAGKDCYVEWPLAANLQEAELLSGLAKQKGVRTMVGLQARRSPIVNALKDIVNSGKIGQVLSCTVVSTAGNFGQRDNVGVKYFMDKKVGGNMVSIHFGHAIDFIIYVLGDLASPIRNVFAIKRPQVELMNKDGTVAETITRETPDQIMLQGFFESGALFSFHQRGGSPFKEQPGLVWRIYGEKGEIITTSAGSFLQVGYPGMDIKVHDFGSNEVETVEWETERADAFDDLPIPARNVARLYDAFADKRLDEYADWEHALQQHKLLDFLYKNSDSPV